MILSAIDIGSNASRMLIVNAITYKDGTKDFIKMNLLRIPLRLGFDVFTEGIIPEEKIEMIIDTMKSYQLLQKIYKVEKMRACATSAMRDAKNGLEVINIIKKNTGINIEIISGHQEANILFQTHIAENLGRKGTFLYIDVGGGSTEITYFSNNKIVAKDSFNIGTIRMLTDRIDDNEWDRMKEFLKSNNKKNIDIKAIGSGGNINKIFSLSKTKEGRPLSLDLLKDYYRELGAFTIPERMHTYNIREDRADVIVPALQIYTTVMKWANANDIYVPKIGLADGLVRQLYQEATAKLNS